MGVVELHMILEKSAADATMSKMPMK